MAHWLDARSLYTPYVDKPMGTHGPIQAIARMLASPGSAASGGLSCAGRLPSGTGVTGLREPADLRFRGAKLRFAHGTCTSVKKSAASGRSSRKRLVSWGQDRHATLQQTCISLYTSGASKEVPFGSKHAVQEITAAPRAAALNGGAQRTPARSPASRDDGHDRQTPPV